MSGTDSSRGTLSSRTENGDQPIALKIFLTGDPGCGKTTVVKRIVERLRGSVPMSGFVTEEVREGARRSGFRGVTIDGRTFTLARAGAAGDVRVGPYGVITAELDAVGVPGEEQLQGDRQLPGSGSWPGVRAKGTAAENGMAGETGIEPATPGFGDRCSAS